MSFEQDVADRADGRAGAVDEVAKRSFDFSVALVAIILLAPLLICLCLLVRASSRGPALFRQTRIGKDGRQFACWKFRSMVVDAEAALARHLEAEPGAAREWLENQKLASDPRITPIGQFLRKSSLDELPQVFNVLAGHMSFVGPRPIVPAESARYGAHLPHYLSVRPGITGLWQVSGRSRCSYAERVALDVAYAQTWRFTSDLGIVLRTVPAVLMQRGSC